MTAVVLIKAKDRIYLMCDDKATCVAGFATVAKAVDHFEAAYNAAHTQSYVASMSACLHATFLQPSVIVVQDDDELHALFGTHGQVSRLWCDAGGMTAVDVTACDNSRALWDKGEKCKLR